MKLYLYGIIDSSGMIRESICGLEGADVYNIPYCDIGAVVSEINQPIQGVSERVVLEHEAVAEKLMEKFTVLPFRLLTILDGRENVLSMMDDYYGDFRDNLDRLRGKAEFGIKVVWPADKVKNRIITTHRTKIQNVHPSNDSAERRFIREKVEEHKINKAFREKADRCINVMDIFLGKFAAAKKLEILRTENLLLSAVYLVAKDNQDNFKEAFEHIRTARKDLKYLFSGPWPPYHFVALRRKSQPLRNSGQTAMFDKVILQPTLVGADKTWQ
jgi:hypothetical protein